MRHYLHGRPQITGSRLSPAAPAADAAPLAPFATAAAGPEIEVVKQGDRVARLIVTCACGERIEVECVYPSAG